MSGYVRNTEFSIEFDGQTVKGILLPLTFKDQLALENTDVNTEIDAARVLAEILPKYVVDMNGLSDAAGVAIDIQEVCDKAYFTELTVGISRKLLMNARPANPTKPSEPSVS